MKWRGIISIGMIIASSHAHASSALPETLTDAIPVVEERIELPVFSRHALSAAITVPQPIVIGYEATLTSIPNLHLFAEGGYFRMKISEKLKSVSEWSIQAGARFFPFQDWLYFSGTLGFRQIGLGADISNLKLDGVALANTADLTLNTAILGIGVGGQWFLGQKIAFSVELGMQLPIPGLHGGNTSIVQDVSDGSDLSVDDTDALRRITNIPIPQIALARFIWYLD